MINIPYDPILHDLSLTPREMSAAEIVEYWLNTIETKDVTEWYEALGLIDTPNIQSIFAGMFGHIMLLDLGLNETIAIGEPFMGKHIT